MELMEPFWNYLWNYIKSIYIYINQYLICKLFMEVPEVPKTQACNKGLNCFPKSQKIEKILEEKKHGTSGTKKNLYSYKYDLQ